jgi:hypothetical protein
MGTNVTPVPHKAFELFNEAAAGKWGAEAVMKIMANQVHNVRVCMRSGDHETISSSQKRHRKEKKTLQTAINLRDVSMKRNGCHLSSNYNRLIIKLQF